MIRDYKIKDKSEIVHILKKGLLLDMSYINNDFSNKNNVIKVYEEDIIKGYLMLTQLNKEKKSWLIDIYVLPEEREEGIGAKLYSAAINYLNEIGVNSIAVRFVSGNDKTESFYKKLGYKKWFGYYEMSYCGEGYEPTDLNFINYEDKYYEKYINLMIEGFYDLRKANDIKPYECCRLSYEGRKRMNNSKDNTYILLDSKDEIISTVVVDNGVIDDLVVNKIYEGQGFGKKTTTFAINKSLEKGAKKINLDVIMWNTKAIHIYEEYGFKIEQGIVSWRKKKSL